MYHQHLTLDAELEQILSRQCAKLYRCGGGGNNTINRISKLEPVALRLLRNTDAQDLLYTHVTTKFSLKEITQGLGAGSVLIEEAGEKMNMKSKQNCRIRHGLYHLWIGWRNGSGSAHVVAEQAKKLSLTVAIVTLPLRWREEEDMRMPCGLKLESS